MDASHLESVEAISIEHVYQDYDLKIKEGNKRPISNSKKTNISPLRKEKRSESQLKKANDWDTKLYSTSIFNEQFKRMPTNHNNPDNYFIPLTSASSFSSTRKKTMSNIGNAKEVTTSNNYINSLLNESVLSNHFKSHELNMNNGWLDNNLCSSSDFDDRFKFCAVDQSNPDNYFIPETSLSSFSNTVSNKTVSITKKPLKSYIVPDYLLNTVTISNNNIKTLLNEKLSSNYFKAQEQNVLELDKLYEIPKMENNKIQKNNKKTKNIKENKKNNKNKKDNKNNKNNKKSTIKKDSPNLDNNDIIIISDDEQLIEDNVLVNSIDIDKLDKESLEYFIVKALINLKKYNEKDEYSIAEIFKEVVKFDASISKRKINNKLRKSDLFVNYGRGFYNLNEDSFTYNKPDYEPILLNNINLYNITIDKVVQKEYNWDNLNKDQKYIILAITLIYNLPIKDLGKYVNRKVTNDDYCKNKTARDSYVNLLTDPYTNKICILCDKNKTITSIISYANINDYKEAFPKKKRYHMVSYVYEALASENKNFTMNEIETFIKLNHPEYKYPIMGIEIFNELTVTKETVNDKEVFYLKVHSYSFLPNAFDLHFVNVINEYRNEQIHNLDNFESSYQDLDINILKNDIIYYYKNFNKFKTNKKKSGNSDSKKCKYVNPVVLNNFIKECFYKLFGMFPNFLDKYTCKNLVIFEIINSFKLEYTNSLYKIIRLWISINKSLDKNFVLYPKRSVVEYIVNVLPNIFKLSNRYILFFESDLNGYGYDKIVNIYTFLQQSDYTIVDNDSNKKNFYLNDKNEIVIYKKAQVGARKIHSYFHNEFLTDLKSCIQRQPVYNINVSYQCDYATIRENSSEYMNGYCIGYCNYHINMLLTCFSMDLRFAIKVLKENNKSAFKSYNWYKLVNTIDRVKIDSWFLEIEKKIDIYLHNLDNMLNSRLTLEQLDCLMINNSVVFNDFFFKIFPKKKNIFF
ncbi:hypothetical protein ABK040_013680 [Willaertia magna]